MSNEIRNNTEPKLTEVIKTPDDVNAAARQRSKEKIDDATDLVNEHMTNLQTAIKSIPELEKKLSTLRTESAKAKDQMVFFNKRGDIEKEKEYGVKSQALQNEIKRTEADLEAKKFAKNWLRQQLVNQDHIRETFYNLRDPAVLVKNLPRIAWYPSPDPTNTSEFSREIKLGEKMEDGTIRRDKIAGKDEYAYWYLDSEGGRRRLLLPGQVDETDVPVDIQGKPILPEVEEKKNILQVMNGGADEKEKGDNKSWEKGIEQTLKDPEQKELVVALATLELEQKVNENDVRSEFRKALLNKIINLPKDNPIRKDVESVWKERIMNEKEPQKVMQTVKDLSAVGPQAYLWIIEKYHAEQDANTSSILGNALVSAPVTGEVLDLVRKQYQEEKNPAKRSLYFAVLVKNDPAFEKDLTAQQLFDATVQNPAARLSILPLLAKRNDPRTVDILEDVLKNYKNYNINILEFKAIVLQVVKDIHTMPGADAKRIVSLCEKIYTENAETFGAYELMPIVVHIIRDHGNPQVIADRRAQRLAKLDAKGLDEELTLRQDEEANKQRFMARARDAVPLNQQPRFGMQDKADAIQKLLNDIPKMMQDDTDKEVQKRVPDVRFMARKHPEIPDAILKKLEEAYQQAFLNFPFTDALLAAVLAQKERALGQQVIRQELIVRFTAVAAQTGLKVETAVQLANDIADMRETQDAMVQILQYRMIAEVMGGDPKKRDQFAKMFITTLGLDKLNADLEMRDWMYLYFTSGLMARRARADDGEPLSYSPTLGGSFVQSMIEVAAVPAVISLVTPDVTEEVKPENVPEAEQKHYLANRMKVISAKNGEVVGIIGDYTVSLKPDSNGKTKAFFVKSDGSKVELKGEKLKDLNDAVLDDAKPVVEYNLGNKHLKEDAYAGMSENFVRYVLGVDIDTNVMTKEQIEHLSSIMHLLFRKSEETIGVRHPLRALGIINSNGDFMREKAYQFQRLFKEHLMDIQDWTLEDILELSEDWPASGVTTFKSLTTLEKERGERE